MSTFNTLEPSHSTNNEPQTLQLPQPGQALGSDRTIGLVEFTITKNTTKKELAAELTKYGLPKSGNRDAQIERLRKFADDREQWAGLFKPAVKRKRGDISASRSNSHSAKRILSQFGPREPVAEYQNKHGSDRRVPQPIQHADEKVIVACLFGQSASFLASYPVVPAVAGQAPSIPLLNPDGSEQAEPCHGHPIEQPGSSQSGLVPGNNAATSTGIDNASYTGVRFRRLERGMSQVERKQDQVLNRMQTLCTKFDNLINGGHGTTSHVSAEMRPGGPEYVPTVSSTGTDSQNIRRPTTPSTPRTAVPPHLVAPQLASDPPTLSTPVLPHPPQRPVCISLDGENIYVDRTHIPDPPAIHLSDNIPSLFREWHTSNLLTIAGRGIPVKHWDKVYKKRSGVVETDAWHALRVEWGNWKFLAEERDRFSSEDAFWDKYSNEERERLSYQQILDRLQKDRTWTDAADYDAAMRYFGGDLGRSDTQGVFRYKKSGKWRICDKKLTVAKKWRALLEKDETIRANWEAMQAASPSD
ncbi:uncharacterized protein C8Q71DRAFT_852898 [Rhodofomes roseus]|uniref:SAP domain-containing protein n=1 Tax=Rhodofomes roseus TaxID=34475 RepID=A0ABQ8KTB5_9APHY|nr:uncharacterized protein C8Q71DRAFT_876053 [Rhodofomes roseus]XP_047783374.1 uncharacterized protein C8Q71DRAFT_852898 [Rhodofomes roseus]KAH9842317.1 hypothetical protein C8Q71DRAFT_876053 [Rhodofomes roseus]KAH9842327.1 hypothetical protein C8Q71DRAFT_852898 [Rhodofomes roseus]